jgi:hypothetical protein
MTASTGSPIRRSTERVAVGVAGVEAGRVQAVGDDPALQLERVVRQRGGDRAAVDGVRDRRSTGVGTEDVHLAERSQHPERGRRAARDGLPEEEFVVRQRPAELAGGGEGTGCRRDRVRLADVVAGAGADGDRRCAGGFGEAGVDHSDVEPESLADGPGDDRWRRASGRRDGDDRRPDRPAVREDFGVGARRVRQKRRRRAGGADPLDGGRPRRPGRQDESRHDRVVLGGTVESPGRAAAARCPAPRTAGR